MPYITSQRTPRCAIPACAVPTLRIPNALRHYPHLTLPTAARDQVERTQMQCGICQEEGSFCASCCQALLLEPKVRLVQALTELASTKQQIQELLTSLNSGLKKDPVIQELKHKLTGITPILRLKNLIKSLNKQILLQSTETSKLQAETDFLLNSIDNQALETKNLTEKAELVKQTSLQLYDQTEEARKEYELGIENQYKEMLHETIELQNQVFADFLEVFNLKRKRKKDGFEIVLNQVVIPDISCLNQYSTAVINNALERVCYFTELLARYTSQTLPYKLSLPSAAQPKAVIGPQSEPLWLPHSVKTMTRSSPKEFYKFCRLLAMLYLDVVSLAIKLGVKNLDSFEEMASLGHILTQIYLILHNSLEQGQNTVLVSNQTAVMDLEGLQEYLITTIDIALNGHSAEWNLIEAPDPPNP